MRSIRARNTSPNALDLFKASVLRIQLLVGLYQEDDGEEPKFCAVYKDADSKLIHIYHKGFAVKFGEEDVIIGENDDIKTVQYDDEESQLQIGDNVIKLSSVDNLFCSFGDCVQERVVGRKIEEILNEQSLVQGENYLARDFYKIIEENQGFGTDFYFVEDKTPDGKLEKKRYFTGNPSFGVAYDENEKRHYFTSNASKVGQDNIAAAAEAVFNKIKEVIAKAQKTTTFVFKPQTQTQTQTNAQAQAQAAETNAQAPAAAAAAPAAPAPAKTQTLPKVKISDELEQAMRQNAAIKIQSFYRGYKFREENKDLSSKGKAQEYYKKAMAAKTPNSKPTSTPKPDSNSRSLVSGSGFHRFDPEVSEKIEVTKGNPTPHVWYNNERRNKYKVEKARFSSTEENELEKESHKKMVEIILAASAKYDMSWADVSDAIRFAKMHKGLNSQTQKEAEAQEKLDANKSRLYRNFSGFFQELCKKQAIYSGREGSMEGLRLTYLPEEVVRKLVAKEVKSFGKNHLNNTLLRKFENNQNRERG